MTKVFYIIDGNKIEEITFDRNLCEERLELIRNKNDNDYLAYDIVELECRDELEDSCNEVITVLKNNIPFRVCVNNYDEAFEFENTYMNNDEDDFKKYTMETNYVEYSISNCKRRMVSKF